jgi:FMN phosphatase YigB (HAD superfamily)
MAKVVLLDFDGVVLQNRVADTSVVRRAGIYTWKAVNRVPRSPSEIGIRQASDLCYNVYKGYGHTVSGLQAIGVDATLADYNKMVYSTIDYKKVRAHNNNLTGVRNLITQCKLDGTEIYMFSNAPPSWMEGVLKDDADILEHVPDVRTVLGISADDDKYLKPQKAIYDAITQEFLRCQKIVFIDDNVGNMKYTIDRPLWTNLVFGTCSKKINNTLHFVSSFDDIMAIV